MVKCLSGLNCYTFGCTYEHPKGHQGGCRNGVKCHRSDCFYNHPPRDQLALRKKPAKPVAIIRDLGNATGRDRSNLTREEVQRSTKKKVTKNKDGTFTEETEVTTRVVSVYGKHAGQTKFSKSAARDRFGNVSGPEYDLSPDNTFKGESIVVLQFYTGQGFTFDEPRRALEKKGFRVQVLTAAPPLDRFKQLLSQSCQLWVISGYLSCQLSSNHITQIVRYTVERKKGLFLWGDNDPFFVEANAILRAMPMFQGDCAISLQGNYQGEHVLEEGSDGEPGFKKHLITTGLESVYEGITVSNISTVNAKAARRRCLMRSSDRKVVTALYDHERVRMCIDGGYTRLYPNKWSRTAGTSRFVINAACWLYNHEGRVQPALSSRPRRALPPAGKKQHVAPPKAGKKQHGAPPKLPKPPMKEKRAVALYDFKDPSIRGTLFFKKGQELVLSRKKEEWWVGHVVGSKTSGLIPANYIKVL